MDWYPWYPALYRADTLHLTAEQDGIYRRLIDHYMETRLPLPDNNLALARIAAVSPECFEHASSILRAFFQQCPDGFLRHKRCDIELDAQDERSGKRSDRARHAATVRWQNQQVTCSPHAPSMLGDATRQDNTIHNKQYTDDFEVFWQAYPSKKNKKDAFKAYCSAIKGKKVTHETLVRSASEYASWNERKDGFTAHASTFINGARWENDYTNKGKGVANVSSFRKVITKANASEFRQH